MILDTDIGTDVDDAWALALCLASPEIELLGVTLVHANLDVRAKIALKMLGLAGRSDVPVYRGLSEPLTEGASVYWAGHEGTETDFSDIAGLEARAGAVEFIIETVERMPSEVTVCSIGPLTNVAAAIARAPGVMRRCAGLVIMASTFEGEGNDAAAREHNACVDPAATRIVLESGIPATLVGLNVTMRVWVDSDDLAQVEDSPLGAYLAAMSRQYMRIGGRNLCYMHDPLAVSTMLDSSSVSTQRMTAHVLDDGRVAYTREERGPLDVAVDVDPERFREMLIRRIGRHSGGNPN